MGSRPRDSRLKHVYCSCFLLTICCLAIARAHAQSFDCSRAATAIERAICADKSLAKLDVTLADEFKRVLDAEPQQRQWLLADQRRWLAYRDKRCDVESTRDHCVWQVYSQRVRHLQSRSIPAAAICHRLAERARISTSVGKRAPIFTLVNESPSSYAGGENLPSFGKPVTELPEWAKEQKPSFVVGPELMEALQAIDDGTIGHLNQVPGTNLYSITHEQGSAHCYVSQFFEVDAGIARPVATPPLIEDGGEASCQVSRGHGRIDGMPAILQSTLDYGPRMSSLGIVVTWDEQRIPSACAMTSWYSPRLAVEQCEGPMCDTMRTGALALIEAVQKSPRDTHERLWSGLTPARRAELDAAVDQAVAARGLVPGARTPTLWEGDEITIDVPLFLPHVHEGQMYVASVGHATAYGRILKDWRVVIESFNTGGRAQLAAFEVTVEQGELEDVSVATSLP